MERQTKVETLQEGPYFPSLSRWSYSNLFTHQNGAEARKLLTQLLKRADTLVIGSEQVARVSKERRMGWDVYALPSDLYLHWTGKVRQKHIDAMIKLAKVGTPCSLNPGHTVQVKPASPSPSCSSSFSSSSSSSPS